MSLSGNSFSQDIKQTYQKNIALAVVQISFRLKANQNHPNKAKKQSLIGSD